MLVDDGFWYQVNRHTGGLEKAAKAHRRVIQVNRHTGGLENNIYPAPGAPTS